MERQIKPENLFVRRNRLITALGAFIFLAVGITLAVVFPLAITRRPPEEDIFIELTVGMSCIIIVCIYLGVLNARNLFFPFLLTADEKGVYNYSGFFHYGFVPWEDINGFTKDSTMLDLLDNDAPSIKIFIKDLKSYKKKTGFCKKWLLFWSGSNIKVYTLCSQIKKKELLKLLDNSLKYYGAPEDETAENFQNN